MSDETSRQPGLEQLLCFDLYAAHQAFGQAYKAQLDPLGLTYPQYLVMVVLWQDSPLSVGEIGQRLGLESNTLTPLLKRMAQAGLIERRRAETDERRVLVSLTDAGASLQRRAAAVPQSLGAATGLSQDEVEALQEQLRRLAQALRRG